MLQVEKLTKAYMVTYHFLQLCNNQAKSKETSFICMIMNNLFEIIFDQKV